MTIIAEHLQVYEHSSCRFGPCISSRLFWVDQCIGYCLKNEEQTTERPALYKDIPPRRYNFFRTWKLNISLDKSYETGFSSLATFTTYGVQKPLCSRTCTGTPVHVLEHKVFKGPIDVDLRKVCTEPKAVTFCSGIELQKFLGLLPYC